MLSPTIETPVHYHPTPRRLPLLHKMRRTDALQAHPIAEPFLWPPAFSATLHKRGRAPRSSMDCLLIKRLTFETLRWRRQTSASARKRDRGASARRRSSDPSRGSCGIDLSPHRSGPCSRVSLPKSCSSPAMSARVPAPFSFPAKLLRADPLPLDNESHTTDE